MTGLALRLVGVDPRAWRTLHDGFWLLATRRATGIPGRRASESSTFRPTAVVGLHLMMGAFFATAVFMMPSRDIFTTSVLAMGLFLLALSTVSEFATVVVAPADDEILFHLPIESRTYLAARLTVATKLLAYQAIPLAVLPAVAAAVRWRSPLEVVLLPAAMLWVAIFALLLSFGLHRVLLRWLGGPRLRSLLAYVPAIASLVFMLGPQLLPSLLPKPSDDLNGPAPEAPPLGAWSLALPPAWFSGIVEAIQGEFAPTMLARAAIGVAVVPLGVVLVVTWLSRGFLEELLRLVADREAGTTPTRERRPSPGPVVARVFALTDADARAGWLLHAGAMRSRDARARAFGAVAPAFVLGVLGALRPQSGFSPTLVGFLGSSSVSSLVAFWPYHEHREAAWIYEAVGPRRYGRFLWGVLARTLATVGIALLALMAVLAAIHRPSLVEAAGIVAAFAAGLAWLPIALGTPQPPPFSCAFRAGEMTGGAGKRFAFMMLAGVLTAVLVVLGSFVPWTYFATIPGTLALAAIWTASVLRGLDRSPPPGLRTTREDSRRPDSSSRTK